MLNLLKIKNLIKQKRYTYKEFASLINVTEQTIHNWFNGRSKISIETLEKIATVLGVPVSYFFDEGAGTVINNGNSHVVGHNNNIQIEINRKDNQIELLKKEVENCNKLLAEKEKQIAMLRETIDLLKEKCK